MAPLHDHEILYKHFLQGVYQGKALLQLVSAIPTFCYTIPGLEHLEAPGAADHGTSGKRGVGFR